MRRSRFVIPAIIIVIFLLLVVVFLAITSPQIGNIFSTIVNDFGTEASDAPSETPRPTREAIQATTVIFPTQATEASDTPAATTMIDTAPTLTTAEFSTQIVDLATAQVLPTPDSVAVASSTSDIAGSGDVISYYNTELAYPNTMRVSLELIFRELAIQPTPLSERFISAINSDIPLPDVVPGEQQVEPPPARDTERLPDIPLEVIAELDCLETSFVGCEALPARVLYLEGINKWNWTIQPVEGISGNQDLTLRLYAADDRRTELYSHTFTVQVKTNIFASNLGAFVLAISIVVVGVISAVAMRSRQDNVKSLGVSAFISYKRRGSWGIAEKIHDGLTSRGVDAFIDSKDLHEGDFEARLTNEIDQRDYLVVVLVEETLQSEWVVKEIAYAFDKGKTVIPVLVEGLKMESLDIPPEISDLNKQNAVSIYQKYFDAGIEELMTFLKPLN